MSSAWKAFLFSSLTNHPIWMKVVYLDMIPRVHHEIKFALYHKLIISNTFSLANFVHSNFTNLVVKSLHSITFFPIQYFSLDWKI